MKIKTDDFRVNANDRVDLARWPTKVEPYYSTKHDYKHRIDAAVDTLAEQQDLFYANHKHALLLIFQAMDAAGKDGAIKHVMSGVNPQGCRVVSFKHPSAQEASHDFLWRTTLQLPERGMIGIFNRSYYEEVLIVRVHPDLLQAQDLALDKDDTKALWKHRFRAINDFERHMYEDNTRIVKVFLHVSKGEQKRRFLDRIDDPRKHWKLSLSDVEERKYWKDYQRAYGACMSATSTKDAPWYVVPADDKQNARLIVSEIVLEALRQFSLTYPPTSPDRLKELDEIRKRL